MISELYLYVNPENFNQWSTCNWPVKHISHTSTLIFLNNQKTYLKIKDSKKYQKWTFSFKRILYGMKGIKWVSVGCLASSDNNKTNCPTTDIPYLVFDIDDDIQLTIQNKKSVKPHCKLLNKYQQATMNISPNLIGLLR
jgi:hypothetical protein